MADIYGLSEQANRQLREMFRDFYAVYVAPVALRKRWHNTGGGGGCKSKLVKTLSAQTANGIVECAQYTGAYGNETVNGELVTCYVRGVDVDEGIWGWAAPLCAVEGQHEGGGTSSVSADGDHPSGKVGPADHEFTPLQCNES